MTAFILELIYTKSIMSEVIKLDTLSVQCNYHLWVVFFVVLPKLFDQLKWELQWPLLVVHCCLEFSPSGQPTLPHWEAGFHQRHWEHKTIKKQKILAWGHRQFSGKIKKRRTGSGRNREPRIHRALDGKWLSPKSKDLTK